MLLKFTKAGYQYTDVDGSVFYEETSDHEGLFKFLAADLSELPGKLESYISKIIDTSTFKLRNYKPTFNDLTMIDFFLYEIHPYFENESREVINNAIGDYFNALLIQATYHEDDYSFSPVFEKEWYYNCFNALIVGFPSEKKDLSDRYYNQYLSIINQDEYLPHLPPVAFHDILSLQEELKDMVFWLLDASAPRLKELTIPQRVSVYGNIHSTVSDQPHMIFTKQISFKDPHSNGFGSHYRRLEYIDGVDHHWTLYGDLKNYSIYPENVHPDAINELERIIWHFKNGYTESIYEAYEVNSLFEVLFLEIYHMILDNTLIKKCRNCGKYFVVKNLNVEYCDRRINDDEESDDNRTCSDVGPRLSYQKKLEEDLPLKFYSRAYKTHYARRKKGKMTQKEFFEWHQEAKEKLDQVRSGNYDFEEYKKWLKK
jgi:hypothetical protein